MNIGSNEIFNQQTLWTNPYASSNLIAMWDGEWNSGKGIHSSEIKIIKDLVGNNDFLLYGTPSVSNKFIDFGGVSYAYADNGKLCEFVNSDFTVEGVFQCTNATIERPYFSILRGTDPNDANRAITMYSALGYNIGVLQLRSTYNYPKFNASSGLFSFSISVSGNSVKFYCNSKLILTGKTGSELYSSSNTTMTIATWQWNYLQRMTDCKFGSFRIYSKQISESDIMKNFEIDKQRFGI